MTIEEDKQVRALCKELWPKDVAEFASRGRLGEAKDRELRWRVYHALVKVGLL